VQISSQMAVALFVREEFERQISKNNNSVTVGIFNTQMTGHHQRFDHRALHPA
jgi:hypothetical protein